MPQINLTLLHLNDLQAHYFPVPITSELIPRLLHIGLLTADDIPNYIKRYEAYRNRPSIGEKDSSPLFELGGYAYIASYLKQVREESPKVIVFDAGDTIQGHPLSTITRGEADYRILNHMIDVGTLGNHEFYFGGDQTLRNLDICRYPVISANVIFADNDEPICGKAYLMKEVGGIKVGIIGVTGLQKTLTTHQTSDGRSIVIREPLPFVRKYVDWLKGKVDVLVLLSHAGGVAIDEKIAEEVSGIDLIITGHSHTVTYPPVVTPKNQTRIVEAGEHGYAVGRLDLTIDTHRKGITSIKGTLKVIEPAVMAPDPEVFTVIQKVYSEQAPILDEVIGYAPSPLPKEGLESPLGNWQADRIREAAGADIAFMNREGIHGALPQGEITVADIYRVTPFYNRIYTFTLSGREILDSLEFQVRDNKEPLFVSGIRYTYTKNKANGSRILSSNLLPDKLYQIASLNYVCEWSPSILGRPVNFIDTGLIFPTVQMDWIRQNKVVRIPKMGRFRQLH